MRNSTRSIDATHVAESLGDLHFASERPGYKVLVRLAASLFMLLVAFAHAQAMTLKIDSLQAPASGQVEIPIVAQGPQKLGPIQFRMSYDPNVIDIVDVKTGGTYRGSVTHKSKTPGELDVFMTCSADEGINKDGPIALVTAKVIGEEGAKTALTLSYVEAFERDTTAPIYIDVATRDGELTVVQTIPWQLIAAIAGAVLFLLIVAVARRGRKKRPSTASASTPTPSSSVTCPQCGHPANASDKYCSGCGQPLSGAQSLPTMCANCGSELLPGKKFCTKCGAATEANHE